MDESPYIKPIALGSFISSISLAFDLAENNQLQHARRVAYIAVRLAEKMGFDAAATSRVLFAGLLHDIGATESFDELVAEGGRIDPAGGGNDAGEAGTAGPSASVRQHPARGCDIVRGLPYLSEVADVIRYHHERWDGLGYPYGFPGREVPLEARVIYLADRLELAYEMAAGGTAKEAAVRSRLEAGGGSEFDPELVAAGRGLFGEVRFWLDLDERNVGRVVESMVARFPRVLIPRDIDQLASVFACLIDNKSPYTANHSRDVAEFTVKLARHFDLPAEKVDLLRVAGLLHDLGKLGVPSSILNKPTRLSPEEYQIVKAHPYYTEHILSQVGGLGPVVGWAAMHHEHLDGTGYHSGASGDAIPWESRLVAVSDVYQALTANRPYRPGLMPEEALRILEGEVRAHRVDAEVVDGLRELALTQNMHSKPLDSAPVEG